MEVKIVRCFETWGRVGRGAASVFKGILSVQEGLALSREGESRRNSSYRKNGVAR